MRPHSAVPLGSPYKRHTLRERFIKFKYHLKLDTHKVLSEFQVKYKLKIAGFYAFDVVVTGLILWYIFHGAWSFLSYGLASALGLYYLQKVVEIIRTSGRKE
jgi:hypothetical protein